MRFARDLDRAELEAVVTKVQRVLYGSVAPEGPCAEVAVLGVEPGTRLLDPDKQWSSEEISEVAEALHAFGLVPDELCVDR